MFTQFLQSGDYAQAIDCLKKGEKLPKDIADFQKTQIFDNLLRNKQFEILQHFATDGTIQTDIYEYDSWNRSIFESIVRYLPNDAESNAFLKDFIQQFENINDEVASQTLLSFFLANGAKIEQVKIVIESGCDVNFKNNADENLLQQVIKTNLMKPELSLSYLELLLAEGLDVNAPNIVQETPLITAIDRNQKTYLDLLLQHGANPNHIDKKGNTAFFYAVTHKFDIEIYQKLREYDQPRFDLLNSDQVSLLFEYLRMINQASDQMLELLKLLLEDGADLYQESEYYGTAQSPIDLLAEKDATVLQTVLDTGLLTINQQDNEGNTLLHKVCAYNVNYEESKAKEIYRKVKLLLENGADPTLTNDKDQNAQMLASDDNLKIKTVELLMKHQN